MTAVMTMPGVLDIIKKSEQDILELTDIKVNLMPVEQYHEAFKSIEQISDLVSYALDIPVHQLKAKTRKREVVLARQICMYYADIYTTMTLGAIGDFYGGRDHTTVIHAKRTINGFLDTNDQALLEAMDKINQLL